MTDRGKDMDSYLGSLGEPTEGRSEMREVSPINAFAERFTADLDKYIRERLPVTMDNKEYASATAAMMLAINRSLATCGVAFAKTHGVTEKFLINSMISNFIQNLKIAYDALENAEGAMVQ